MNAPRKKIPVEHGIPRWSQAAVELLTETATDYNRVLTTPEFAAAVQSRSGAWANVTSQTWLRKVLKIVTLKCEKEQWPHLASLVVRPSDGKPGPWYIDVLAATGPGAALGEAHHAAEQRLACYRQFGADVPKDATPDPEALRGRRQVKNLDIKKTARAPQPTNHRGRVAPAKTRTSTRSRPPATERRGEVCPICFMEMPVSGTCASCS